jgi:hypothetical protein
LCKCDEGSLTWTRLHSTSHLTLKRFPTSSWASRHTVLGSPNTKSCTQTRSGFRPPCAISTPL